jgi:hypothetical protein
MKSYFYKNHLLGYVSNAGIHQVIYLSSTASDKAHIVTKEARRLSCCIVTNILADIFDSVSKAMNL